MNSFQFKGFGLAYPVFVRITNWQRDWRITCKISIMKILTAIKKIALPLSILVLIVSCKDSAKKRTMEKNDEASSETKNETAANIDTATNKDTATKKDVPASTDCM